MRDYRTAVRPAWLLACASAAAILGAGSAQAEDLYGSAAIFTNRNCPAGATSCTSPGSLLQPRQYFGGAGTEFSASSALANGASAAASVAFGGDYLPTVKVGSTAGAFTRTGASATAIRAFTYGGDAAIDLAINGMLHFLTSGDVATAPNVEVAGDGSLNVSLALVTVASLRAAFPEAPSAVDLISSPITFPDCGGGGVIAVGGYSTNLAGVGAGEFNQAVGLNSACGGGAIRVNPGDSFVVIASLQAISNRGGFLDAMHSFTVQYDEAHTYLAGTTEAVGQGFLSRNVAVGAAVPEPASWALMIGGFGLAGSTLRRRASRSGSIPAS